MVAIGTAAAVTAQEVSDRAVEAVPPPKPPPEARPLPPPRSPRRGGPNPYVVIGVAFAVGFTVGKLLDRRSRGHASG